FDVDAIADQDAAGLQHLIPFEAEVLPVHGTFGDESHPLVAPRILGPAAVLDVEGHLPRDVTDRQVAGHPAAVVVLLLDAPAPEAELGKLLDIEEIGRSEVCVSLGHAGVDAGRINRDLDDRSCEIAVVDLDAAGIFGEPASDL